jgi:hypothetical protein
MCDESTCASKLLDDFAAAETAAEVKGVVCVDRLPDPTRTPECSPYLTFPWLQAVTSVLLATLSVHQT